VVKVCQTGKRHDWIWFERYQAAENNTVKPVGAGMYCEYPAILVRVVLKNRKIFLETAALRV
jgi:hypothetical protein